MARQVSTSTNAPRLDTRVINALVELGFSQYEARTYAGLIGREPMTGYAVAKETSVPQPKVYETLVRLVERGAVVQISSSPAKFIAVSPTRVLNELESAFRQRLATVELEISRMRPAGDGMQTLRPFQEATSWVEIAAAARQLIASAGERVYVSGHSSHLEALGDALADADRRGARIDVLCFGEPPFSLKNGTFIRHSSTDGTVYRHHQARHLALTCDMAGSLWALAPEGDAWEAVFSTDDTLLAALVKGFVRHDIFMQRTYHDFADDMRARYGAGLEGLFDWSTAASDQRGQRYTDPPEADQGGLRSLA
ncbi:TrmB family transcriptional regulator [Streptomyces sp. NPDC056656]|uniref:TrmB family transcriptional regulator n=1 Tax=Streptomyces sp. NPDC056656 TaxID=3345895 RepID=UPI0036B1E22F